MKKLLQYLLIFLFTIPFYGQTHPSYYNGLDLDKTGNDLFLELSGRIISTHSGIPYTSSTFDVWDACKAADEDPDNAANVLLIYGFNDTDGDYRTDRTRNKNLQDTGGTTGTWNREHVFPKSLANPILEAESGLISPGSDVHNLRPADTQRNSSRNNRKFTDGSGYSRIITTDGGWYPGDEWKGDIARIVMYMYTRYHGTGTQSSETNCFPKNVGFGTINNVDSNMVDLFLKWNVEDPVSAFEANRNEVLAGIQGNRNPFIDNPYLATLIWGGLVAEDKWNMNGSSDAEAPAAPTNLVSSNITDTSATISWNASTDNIGVYDYLIYVNGVYLKSTTSTSVDISNLISNTTYQITVKARDVSNNLSVASSVLNVSTLVGPLVVFSEDFSNCSTVKFVAYNEASTKNWACEVAFGENNSSSYGINGYQEEVASKDWLITINSIDFDANAGEKLSFYTDAAYGSSKLELVYSSNYDGVGNPANFTWISVPNITIPIKSNTSSTEEVFTFSDVDISSITGSVYFAFKYYSNGTPTRWTVDSFKITADQNDDLDNDGVSNTIDICPDTPAGETVNATGCSNGQLDDDNDGVQNSLDICANTPAGETVNATGCSQSQIDDDNDNVMNNVDTCPDTPAGETVNATGCSNSQLDDDNDGVKNNEDKCPSTTTGSTVDANGCFTLNSNNFSIETISETCPNRNNGQIKIVAVATHNYEASIDGTNYNFTNNSLIVSNLAPKTYNVCISVTGETYQQCFVVKIDAGTTVSAKTNVSSKSISFDVEKGTPPFKVFVNNAEVLNTNDFVIFVDNIKQGDLVELKTSVICEGIVSERIALLNEIVAYPNPTKGSFAIAVSDDTSKNVNVELYNMQSQLISSKSYEVKNGKIQLSIEDQPTGIYIVKVKINQQPLILKLIKE